MMTLMSLGPFAKIRVKFDEWDIVYQFTTNFYRIGI